MLTSVHSSFTWLLWCPKATSSAIAKRIAARQQLCFCRASLPFSFTFGLRLLLVIYIHTSQIESKPNEFPISPQPHITFDNNSSQLAEGVKSAPTIPPPNLTQA